MHIRISVVVYSYTFNMYKPLSNVENKYLF